MRHFHALTSAQAFDPWTAVAAWLDRGRCVFLRQTLRWPWARRLYLERPRRLALFCLSSMMVALLLAWVAPLFSLAAGPLIYGLPHLITSVRYSATIVGSKRASVVSPVLALGGLLAVVAAIRLLAPASAAWLDTNQLELWALFAGTGVCAYATRQSPSKWRAVTLILAFTALATASWQWPLLVMGLISLAHNIVGFVYWLALTRQPAERRAAGFALAVFVALNILIFAGAFPAPPLHFGQTSDEWDIGATLITWSLKPQIWQRAVFAYAFGQSVHYFLWLRAIPEQGLKRPAPVTFRQSLGLLGRDFGKRRARFALSAAALLFLAWIGAATLGHFAQARTIYFALASAHGYLEVAALAAFFLVRSRPRGVSV